ncbi:MAG: DUF2075 domain-containing protein [Candidatus Aenigmarchaeota archaeon]|nr:DUF2075 domain-containing protein [Candidatus Aenigmarchaeota archaeon]
MRLYSGTVNEFIEDAFHNKLSSILTEKFEIYYGRRVNPREVVSWNNSLQFLKNVVERYANKDNMIVLESELPYCGERIDAILFGEDDDNKENIVIIELKQWENVESCEIEDNVITYVGGAKRMVPHPSVQVKGYHYYLTDFVDIFHEEKVGLSSCVYCHNYSKNRNAVLFRPEFEEELKNFPVFTREDFEKLGEYIKKKIGKGKGIELFNRFLSSNIKPSKKLVDYTSEMIKGQRIFNLIDDQIAANNTIIDRAKKCAKLKNKSVIIIRGGPGTGKSVIALNALAELLSKGHTVYHATGSAAFTQTLRKIVGFRASKLFKYFNNFGDKKENEIDILICDEAHRIRRNSNLRYTPSHLRTDTPQVEELINSSKVSVFFLDEYQIVRPTEIGGVELIRKTAEKFGADIYGFELKTQFRCNGSDGYLNWVDNLLGVRETKNTFLTQKEKMEIKIFDSPHKLYEAIKKKNEKKPNSARMVAGFCWPWSNPRPDGTLENDVVIGDFRMPWEGKTGYKLAPNIPPAPLWAYEINGVNQIGCIYTIQGFEFDYVGVIFAEDLSYDPGKKEWVCHPENSSDPALRINKENFMDYVRNVYRVLLTRGMKGCYIYFMNKDTENFFRSRIKETE